MTVYPNRRPRTLSDSHRRMLFEESGIDPGVVAERGTFTATRGKDVPQDRGKLPAKPGLVFPVHTLDGGIFHRLRPDNPGRSKAKYMQPKGAPNRLDVHPRQHEAVKGTGGMRYITEGEKKVDAGVSRGMLMVGLSGVWNGQKAKELIPDWDLLPKAGEDYSILFDSDIETNEHVQAAAERQAGLLRACGANIHITLLPPAPDGGKQGLDDFFANGGTVKQLELLTRPYDEAVVERVRLTRDQKLRAAFEDLERRHSDTAWTWRGADADEDLFLAVAGAARKHGKIHADGIRVRVSWGTLALEAKIGSSRTVGKGLARLQARGLLHKDNAGREEGKTGAFVLVAGVKQVGESPAEEEKTTRLLRESYRTTLHPQSPRLRASRPKLKPTKKMIQEHRLGTRSRLPEPREGLKRLGKKRSHVFDRLDAGGTLSVEELGGMLGVRPYDLTRRKTSPKGRDGLLAWPEEAGIILIEGNTVALADDWLNRLEEAREKGEELEADERAEKDRKRRSRAYREYLAERRRGTPAASKPSAAGLEAVRRSREKAHEHNRKNLVGWVEDKTPPPLSPLAVAVRDYLDKHPRDARQPAGWIGSTLWALERFDGKPNPAATKAAVEELGGAAYLDETLKRAKEVA